MMNQTEVTRTSYDAPTKEELFELVLSLSAKEREELLSAWKKSHSACIMETVFSR